MPTKPTLLTNVAEKIGSTLGAVAAEAGKVVRPLRMKASRVVSQTKPRARRMARHASAWASRTQPIESTTRREARANEPPGARLNPAPLLEKSATKISH
jgi:hypothetical protein